MKGTIFQAFAGLQWLSFMFANTVVIPLSIGSALHLSSPAIAGMMSRSFVITALACLAQAVIGHRFPLMEGQSGMWWASILSLTAVFATSGLSFQVIGGSMEVGIMLSGALIMLSGLVGLHRPLQKLFNPVVMAVLLFLLGAQLIHIFFLGMMGISGSVTHIQLGPAAISIAIVILVSAITLFGRGHLGNFSILIGMIIGWIGYVCIFGSTPVVAPSMSRMTETFTWGKPHVDVGVLVSMVVIGLVNITNTIATMRSAEPVFQTRVPASAYQRSFVVTGLFTVLAGWFSVVPYAPYTSSIGFLRTTRVFRRLPFVIGAVFFVILGVVPQLVGFFSTMPISVGDAVLFVAYLQLFGAALQNIEAYQFNFKTIFRVALPTLAGLAVLSTPADAFSSLPGVLQPLCSNGMIVGIVLSIILEISIRWNRLVDQ